MATCSQCGMFVSGSSGGTGFLCAGCSPLNPRQQHVLNATPGLPPGVTVSDYRDCHDAFPLDLRAGAHTPEALWLYGGRLPYGQAVIREVRAVITGNIEDVATVRGRTTVRFEEKSGKPFFERPLSVLSIMDKERDTEAEARIDRLERMMNVLVEQDSPAGEALRRLGGAKIDSEGPTRLARPALLTENDGFHIRLIINDHFQIAGPVTVRVSLIGVAKYPVP